MVGYCIICKWRSDYQPQRMFHKFPTDPTEQKAWAKTIGRGTVKPNATLCSLHFKRSCYTRKKNGQPYLKRGSMPTQHIKEQPSNIVPGRLRPAFDTGSKSDSVKRKFVCEYCNRKFLNKSALKSHLYHVHQQKVPTRLGKTVKTVDTVESDTKMPETDSRGGKPAKLVKPSFECPVCERQFSIYFTAFQHIQKVHCVDSKGQKVSPLSVNIVKPVRIEVCICNQMIRSDTTHICPVRVDRDTCDYLCLGCGQEFLCLALYQSHLRKVHGDNIASYFFPARSEFTAWKTMLENQTRSTYLKMNDTMIYHCSHQPEIAGSNITHMCPSTIVAKQISNGYHMTLYKTHVGHNCKEYTTSDTHKKNCITKFYNETEDIDVGDQEDEKDLYLQFKRVMNSIVLDAAKINISTLEVLLGKAFEMTAVLNSYDEDDDRISTKKISDEQISRVLEDKTVNCKVESVQQDSEEESAKVDDKPMKRKREPLQRETKKVRSNDSNEEVTVKIESPITPARTIQSPPSFNDSYKSFVDQTIMKVDKKDKKKAEIVKTKIGQFKTTPKSETPKTETTKIVTPKTKTVTPKTSNKIINIPEKSKSPPTRMPIISKVWTVKPDVKYEVKERDNDCNILILKI